jgi:hypothetical protein
MAKQPNRITIASMPWRAGLTNQGGQATIAEHGLWEAKNVEIDSTGRLFKRRAFRKWGQTLQSATPGGYQYIESFSDTTNFNFTRTVDTSVVSEIAGGNLRFTTKSTVTNDWHQYERQVQPNDGAVSTNNVATCNFFIRARTALPAIATDTTQPAGPTFHMRSDHANIFAIMFLDDGIYYYDGADFVQASTDNINDGQWHKVQVQLTTATAATVVIDDTNSTDIASFSSLGVMSLSANQIGFMAQTNDNGVYAFEIGFLQYRDGAVANFGAASMQVIKDWSSRKPNAKHLVAVTNDTIYDDLDHTGFFNAIDRAPSGDVSLIPWLSELIIAGSGDVARRWAGSGTPDLVPSAMPARIAVGTAHQGRLYVATSSEPLRVRYSDVNDLGSWTTVQNDVEFESSFDIPDSKGRRITAMRGDFYGLLIIWTENSTPTTPSAATFYSSTRTACIACPRSRSSATSPRPLCRATYAASGRRTTRSTSPRWCPIGTPVSCTPPTRHAPTCRCSGAGSPTSAASTCTTTTRRNGSAPSSSTVH